MLVCEALAKYVADTGVDTQFGVVGEGNIALVTALAELGVTYVAARREDAAVGMADGWSRRRGLPGFVSVTSGPGLTNTLTSLVEAVRHGTAMVLLASTTPAAALQHPQHIDAAAFVAATGAGWREVRSSRHLAEDVHFAFRSAVAEGRPYVLGLSQDLLYQEVDGLLLDGTLPEGLPEPLAWTAGSVGPDPDRVEQAVGMLAAAKRPLIVAGRGVAAGGGADELIALAEHLGAPLATTLLGKGLFAQHPSHIGIFGGFSTEHGSEVIPEADLVLAFGCSLNPWTTMEQHLTDGAVVIQCDTRREAIGRWLQPDLALIGDAATTAAAMLDAAREAGEARTPWARQPAAQPIAPASTPAPLPTLDVARTLAALLPPEVTVAFDSGHAMADFVPRLPVSSPERFVYGLHAGSIGLGLGLALGAATAAAPEWTVLLVGDGALSMSLQELDTLRQTNLPVIVVVLDDGAYGAEIHYSAARGLPATYAFTDNPDYVTVAEGLGITARRVDTLGGLAVINEIMDGPRRPTLVHVPIASTPMNRWYESFSAQLRPVAWTGMA